MGNIASLRHAAIENRKTALCWRRKGTVNIRITSTATDIRNRINLIISTDEMISASLTLSFLLTDISLVAVRLNPKLISMLKY